MKSVHLGKLETQIMEIIWEEENCSVRDVLLKIKGEKKLAYTTIATVLQRLYDKGMLIRKVSKSGHIYAPKISKENYSKGIAKSFLKNFIDSFGDTAVVSFAEGIDKLPSQKRSYFLKLIKKYDKSK